MLHKAHDDIFGRDGQRDHDHVDQRGKCEILSTCMPMVRGVACLHGFVVNWIVAAFVVVAVGCGSVCG